MHKTHKQTQVDGLTTEPQWIMQMTRITRINLALLCVVCCCVCESFLFRACKSKLDVAIILQQNTLLYGIYLFGVD